MSRPYFLAIYIKIFSRYSGSSTLMATCVILTDFDWPLVKISLKTAKFRKSGQQKSYSSKIFQNLFLCSDDLLFTEASLWARTLSYSIVSCAILRDPVSWSFKKNSVKFGSRKAEIRICPTGRPYSKILLLQNFLWVMGILVI